jgi:histidinol phosphatase-like enzyme (inositol monophosphatase family)
MAEARGTTSVVRPQHFGSIMTHAATPPHATPSTRVLLAGAHAIADTAGRRILPYFRKTLAVENKEKSGGFDPVTEADKAAERAMRKEIRARFPEHGITGEEYSAHASQSRYRWVLDPIDGTRAFMCGLPSWGVLIGLLDADAAVLGLMDQPHTRERFWAAGGKAQMRGPDGKLRRLATRPCAKLADAVLSSTSPEMFKTAAETAAFAHLTRDARLTRYGADCYAYAMLAAGHIDLVVEAGLKDVDIVALIPLIEAAGGVVTTWNGGSAISGGNIVASGDRRLHDKVLRVLG